MWNYKARMNKYRLPKERYKKLRKFCLQPNYTERLLIERALKNVFNSRCDTLLEYIFLHVTSSDYNWAKLEAEQIPCNRDTFNAYRAQFFFELNKILEESEIDL